MRNDPSEKPFAESANTLRQEEAKALANRNYSALIEVFDRWERLAGQEQNELRKHHEVGSGQDTFLVTGGAGFIGCHLTARLAKMGHPVIIIDNFNDYYDPILKYKNLARLLDLPLVSAFDIDFRDSGALEQVFRRWRIDQIVHLGARAGVRPSLERPQIYVTTNVLGTQNLLDMAYRYGVKNFVYASSSSVYGGSTDFPYAESNRADNPISPYAATKRANELQAACYHNLYGFPVTGLRFFTAYGPYGRPDMAYRKFVELMDRGEPVPMYGNGSTERDYTYIDDIIDGVVAAVETSVGKKHWCEIFNLGESATTNLRRFILLIATYLGRIRPEKAVEELTVDEEMKWMEVLAERGFVKRLPEQPGDVPKTFADIEKPRKLLGYNPRVGLPEGLRRFVEWYRQEKSRNSSEDEVRFWAGVSEYNNLKSRLSLDDQNQVIEACYTHDDLVRMCRIRDLFAESLNDGLLPVFAAWLLERCALVMGDIAAYLPDKDGLRPCGVSGLLSRKKRTQSLT